PRVKQHHAPADDAADADDAVPRGKLVVPVERQVRDITLLDLQWAGPYALAPRVKQYHAARAAAATRVAVPRAESARRVGGADGEVSALPLLGRQRAAPPALPFPPNQHNSARTEGAVPRGESAPRVEGDAGDLALLDLQWAGPYALAPRVKQHHSATRTAAIR